MAQIEPNYVKKVLTSQWNLGFVGIMIFLMLIINFIGFGALLLAGEIFAIVLAQLPAVQQYYRLQEQIEGQQNLKEKSNEIAKQLPPQYSSDFQSVEYICDDIENKFQSSDASNNFLLRDLITKLGSFRYEYARMLNAHFLTSTKDVNRLTNRLQGELQNNVNLLQNEKNAKVQEALKQNARILKQRLQRALQMSDLQRLLEARLAVVKNSLNLLHDEVTTTGNPEDMSSAVNNLLLTLNIDEELKATYEDVLSDDDFEIPLPNQQQQNPNLQRQRQSNLRRVK
ncbi:MAG: hypothetical protein K1X72_27555 [Pyrinomonadaceae bacterium]|nr:hypothetical protein [Pyrinomonadaceae bacterium]